MESYRGENTRRLRNEWRTAAPLERLSGADRRARLERHLLGEAHYRHHGRDQALRWVLDEDCLPDSGWEISAGRAFYLPGDGHEHAGYRNGRELAHYEPKRWHARQGGEPNGHKRDSMGWRLRHSLGRNLGRQWRDLGPRRARGGLRQIRFSPLEL